ncbi:hypothetical protein [Pseudoalteromonas ardens]|uniref:Uncharacterized protein n=1 Tax=Pseudoalteromonas rubra TaxID=43658 RepID=A0A0L0ESA9_9GAMM|nr:hypothetical protein [Pseudoalteromonas sp. R96]KNC67304.1 hypothetical protein AC626_11610 [Pseudoalteromonas rubra]MDK1312897.1 hypothetical protein [Pseudoalteromonas sp. R96]
MSCEYFADKGMKIEGNYWLVHPNTGEAWNDESVATFIAGYVPPHLSEEAITSRKTVMIGEIKRAVYDCLEAQLWRVTKAHERVQLAHLGGSEVERTEANAAYKAELEKREALRQKSDEAELQVADLTSIDALDAFSFKAEL